MTDYKEIDYEQLIKERERLQNQPSAVPPYEILRFPDPRLRRKAQPVAEVTDEIRDIANKLLATMYASAGVGLAATQVDIHRQIIVMDVSAQRNHPMCLINPEIVEREGEMKSEEGCLSVPGITATVKRSAWVRVSSLDRHGQPAELEAEGFLADCVQHEMDHLRGRLFIDHLSPLKRRRLLNRLSKQQRKEASAA